MAYRSPPLPRPIPPCPTDPSRSHATHADYIAIGAVAIYIAISVVLMLSFGPPV